MDKKSINKTQNCNLFFKKPKTPFEIQKIIDGGEFENYDKAEGLILQNRSILADQMDFLRDFLPKHSRLR